MKFIKNNRDAIIVSIVATIIYTFCAKLLGRLIEWIAPEQAVKLFQEYLKIDISWIITGIILMVTVIVLLIHFLGINQTVTINKRLFKRWFNIAESEFYVINRSEIALTAKHQCICPIDINTYPTWYAWTGTESSIESNKSDCVVVKDSIQKDDKQRWHLEFRSPKKAYKPFDIDYTIHGKGEFSPVYGIYVNYPMKKLILKVKFNAQDENLKLKYICESCQISNSDMIIYTKELELDKYEYTFEVNRPKLFHHYRIEWVYKDS